MSPRTLAFVDRAADAGRPDPSTDLGAEQHYQRGDATSRIAEAIVGQIAASPVEADA